MRILIIEDEEAIVRFLERGLAVHGHSVVSTDNGDEGVLLATEETVDFVLLDLMLPGFDGHDVLRRIRAARPSLPVLMLTARDELENKVNALEAGADDYLTKPFAFEELLARIRALTRRADQIKPTHLQSGDLHMDLVSRRVWRVDKVVELTSREFALLECLLRRPGQVVPRQQILSEGWGYAFDPGTNVVDVYVRYLRRKIDRPGEPSLIQSARGVGYRFNPPAAS
jgi:DNA-binding response OmpR family regulator